METRRASLKLKEESPASAKEVGAGRRPDHRQYPQHSSVFCPLLSLPSGFTTAGLPIGLQIVGAPFAESTVLALAHAYERETEWHKRHPKLDLA